MVAGDNEIMRRKQTESNVRTITTGHAEADMLGQVYLWISERKNSRYAQRPHRTYKRVRQPESIFRKVIECIQTAPTACWRSIKFANKYGRRLASVMRRNKRNGN